MLITHTDSENAKSMMVDYHIGTLDDDAAAALAGGDESTESDPTRAVFLQPKVWTKAILEKRTTLSHDTKLFTFKLDHDDQAIGLPTGQHLMMRLREPATREAIIRAYTPMSEVTDKGRLNVLIKIYFDAADRPGGKMTQALNAIPLGHFVDFKGPVGKFEYLGKGICSISGKERKVKRFIMICGGSGVTPIFQVLRAVMTDRQDETKCLLLDGNRTEEDILCRQELDDLTALDPQRCQLVHTLTRASPSWTGRRGRLDETLFKAEVGPCKETRGDDLVLICGPEAMESSVRTIFYGMGWKDEDLLFF
jgi:nitrate reductase (NAD(P)H)